MLYHPFNQYMRPVVEHMNWKGGGPETVETLPDWMRPYIEQGMSTVQSAYGSGDLSNVAGLTADQTAGFDALRGGAQTQQDMVDLATGIAGGGEMTDTSAMKDAAAYRMAVSRKGEGYTGGGLSNVGGGRGAVQDAVKDAELQAAYAQMDYDALQADRARMDSARQEAMAGATAGGTTLSELGAAQQEQNQAEMDATYQGLQRMAELYGIGGGAQQQATGGK